MVTLERKGLGGEGGEGPMEEDEDEEQWYKIIRIERGGWKRRVTVQHFVFVMYIRIQCINQSLSTKKKDSHLIKLVHGLEEPTYLSHRNISSCRYI